MQKNNDWGVSYVSIRFFENALRSHRQVRLFSRSNDILFHLTRANGEKMNVLLVDEYTLGLAAVHRAIAEFPGTEHIVTSGMWNGYTQAAKDYGMENDIGIFVVDEFLGALNRPDPIKYVKKDADGKPIYRYRTA